MAYQVVLTDTAKADADQLYRWVVDAAPTYGPKWFNQLVLSLQSLDRFPNRCPLAREAHRVRGNVRCMLFGKGRNRYRILYEVDEARETVWILHIRHGARGDMDTDEITKPPS
jgi:plasmid stabilization system protein ParE